MISQGQMHTHGTRGSFIVVQSWQTLLLFLGLLGSVIAGYTLTKYQGEENTRRIEELEKSNVRKEQLEDVQRRLQRIEDKLDRRRSP
jgi:sensor histidine kinase YesM